jgi:hypothetical protein
MDKEAFQEKQKEKKKLRNQGQTKKGEWSNTENIG